MKLTLAKAWFVRLTLHAKGRCLCEKAEALQEEGIHLLLKGQHTAGEKLYGRGEILWAAGDKLISKANQTWRDAVVSKHGPTTMTWRGWNHCTLSNGDVFMSPRAKARRGK